MPDGWSVFQTEVDRFEKSMNEFIFYFIRIQYFLVEIII